MKTKSKNRVIIWTFFAIFLVVGFGFSKVEKVNAGYCAMVQKAAGRENKATILPRTDYSSQSCTDECDATKAGEFAGTGCQYNESKEELLKSIEGGQLKATLDREKGADICDGIELTSPSTWMKCILLYVLKFIGALIIAASTLFLWVIDTKSFTAVVDNKIIYEMWGFVRDMLNIAFILVLLFSAFCTVFQISKYSYKSLLVTLIIMALLVNFSFPIARVIIDFSNVIMYYLINNMGMEIKDGSFFANIAKNGELSAIVNPGQPGAVDMKSDVSFLIAAVVFSFIFMVTLFIIAVLLLIRIVVLAVLIIFASVAFVGSIVPFLSKYASEWWDTLFKYAFFGPVMIFMMVVATRMMGEIVRSGKGQIKNIANVQANGEIAQVIASFAFFSIPIVILWVGIGSAQKMSIAGAGAVVGRGQKFMNWVGGGVVGAGKWGTKAPFRGALWGAKQTGIPGGMKIKYDDWKKRGRFGSEARESREASFAGGKAQSDFEKKKIKEIRDKWKDAGGASNAQIDEAISSKDTYKKKAAAMEMAEKKGFGDGKNPSADLARYQKARDAVRGDGVLENSFSEKVKEKYIKFAINDDIQSKKTEEAARLGRTLSAVEERAIEEKEYDDKLGKMSFEQLAKQQGFHENIAGRAADPAKGMSALPPDINLQRHIHNMARRSTSQHQKFFEKLSAEQQAAYESARVAP